MVNLKELTEFQQLTLDEGYKVPGVLGVVRGTFCIMESPSRNGRVYPYKAWKKVVCDEDFKRKLNGKLIFGTVGHKEIDTDSLISELKVSHRLTKLDINEDSKVGNGEAEILDTPVGRVLYTLIKSGSKMAVSSKAEGSYSGKTDSGVSVVDENTFRLDRFDFVTDPGFLQAQPELLESLQEAYNNNEKYQITELKDLVTENKREFIKGNNEIDKNKEVFDMDVTEKLIKEKFELENQLKEATNTVAKLEKDVSSLSSNSEKVKGLEEEVKGLKVKITESETLINKWGGSKVIEEKLSQIKNLEEVVGTVDEVVSTLKLADSFVDNVISIGSISQLKEQKKDSAILKNLVNEVGTPGEIRESIKKSIEFVKKLSGINLKKRAESLSVKFGVEVKKIQKMLEKMNYKDVESALSDIKESLSVKTNKKKEEKPSTILGEANRATRMLNIIK